MSTGGCGISLDGDSVSKEFQSPIVLVKRILVYITAGGPQWYRRIRMTSLP